MAEVVQIPGKGFLVLTVDGEVKQIPGQVFYIEEPASSALPLIVSSQYQMTGSA